MSFAAYSVAYVFASTRYILKHNISWSHWKLTFPSIRGVKPGWLFYYRSDARSAIPTMTMIFIKRVLPTIGGNLWINKAQTYVLVKRSSGSHCFANMEDLTRWKMESSVYHQATCYYLGNIFSQKFMVSQYDCWKSICPMKWVCDHIDSTILFSNAWLDISGPGLSHDVGTQLTKFLSTS